MKYLKFAMIETKESLENLDEIMKTPGLDGIYIGPADLSLAIGEKPSFDKPEGDPVYEVIMKILEHAKKNKIIAGIQNGQPEYAEKMIKKGFQLVTIGSDQRYMTAASKTALSKLKKDQKKDWKRVLILMKYYVYMLKSLGKNQVTYVGYTNNLKKESSS